MGLFTRCMSEMPLEPAVKVMIAVWSVLLSYLPVDCKLEKPLTGLLAVLGDYWPPLELGVSLDSAAFLSPFFLGRSIVECFLLAPIIMDAWKVFSA